MGSLLPCSLLTLAFLHDFLPQRLHQNGVRVSSTVDDGQFALRQFEVISKLPVELSKKAFIIYLHHTLSSPTHHTSGIKLLLLSKCKAVLNVKC